MTEYDTVLYALRFEPASARPGDIVHLRFCARNVSRDASPAGTIEFLTGDGLDALGVVTVEVAPVDAGADVCADLALRVGSRVDDGASLAAQAVLRLGGDVLGTNVAAVLVRAQPILDGPGSGTFVDAVAGGLLAVRAVVTNEGDGPAHALTLTLAAPHGCTRTDGDGPATLTHDRLEPGESVTLALTARIVAPAGAIEAAGDVLARGTRVRLAARSAVAPKAELVAPVAAVSVSRRRASLTIELSNAGWADAGDVSLTVALPPGVRPVRDAITLDGIPLETRAAPRTHGAPVGRLAICGSRCEIVASSVPGQSTARIVLAVTYAATCEAGTFRVMQGPWSVEAPFVPHVERDLRLRIEGAPAVAARGDVIALSAVLVNGGDLAETVTLRAAGSASLTAPAPVVVSAGRTMRIALRARIPDTCNPGMPGDVAIVALDGEGNACCRAATTVELRDATAAVPDLDLLPVARSMAARALRAQLEVPDVVTAGAAFDVQLVLDADAAIETLTIRAAVPAATAYIAGSTAIDGRRALDPAGGSPLAAGLVLHELPPRSRVVVTWSLLTEAAAVCDGVRAEAALDADGVQHTVASAAIALRHRVPFTTRAPGSAYHVTGCAFDFPERCEQDAVVPEPVMPPGSPDPDAIVLALPLAGEQLDDAARLLRAGEGKGLAAHVLALRALFPAALGSDDPAASGALRDARAALADVLDRLYVKLRIPGFDATADDLEDGGLRSAIVALLGSLLAAAPGEIDDGALCISIERSALRGLLEELEGTALGAPAMLRVLTALLPTRCDDEPLLAATLARYVCALDAAFARCADGSRDAFDRTLSTGRDIELDDARSAVTAALRARTVLTAVAW